MEKQITITQCDICENKVEMRYELLTGPAYGWTKYRYDKDWRSGIHKGTHKLEFIVCKRCDRGRGIRFLFYKMKNLFLTDN